VGSFELFGGGEEAWGGGGPTEWWTAADENEPSAWPSGRAASAANGRAAAWILKASYSVPTYCVILCTPPGRRGPRLRTSNATPTLGGPGWAACTSHAAGPDCLLSRSRQSRIRRTPDRYSSWPAPNERRSLPASQARPREQNTPDFPFGKGAQTRGHRGPRSMAIGAFDPRAR